MPAFEPPPVTTLNTPAGSPPSCSSSAKRSVVSGVVPAGLATTVLPATSAGASLLDSSVVGKFHGHDRADDAERPAQHDAVDAGIEVRRVRAAQRLGEPDVVHQRVDRLGDLDAGVAQRLALLAGEQRDQLVEVLLDVVRGLAEDLAALGDGQRRPVGERAPRRPARRASTSSAVPPATSAKTWPSAGLVTGSGSPALRCSAPSMNAPAYVVETAIYAPVNSGVRFSPKAVRPSLASCERKSSSISSRSSASPSSSDALDRPRRRQRLIFASASGGSLASRSTCASNAAASSNSSETRPSRSASSGPSWRPVSEQLERADRRRSAAGAAACRRCRAAGRA